MYELFFVSLHAKKWPSYTERWPKRNSEEHLYDIADMSEERNEQLQVPAVMGTGDAAGVQREAEYSIPDAPKYWFIARVSPNTEKSTRTKLQALGYEAFVAAQQELRYWKNGPRIKKKKVERVVITQYIFLHISRKERETLVRHSFIREFMKNRATQDKMEFALVSDSDMEYLMRMFGQSDHPVLFDTTNYTVGEEVRLHLGSYDYTGHVVRKRGDSTTYYGIRISELGCAYMEVPPSALSRQ